MEVASDDQEIQDGQPGSPPELLGLFLVHRQSGAQDIAADAGHVGEFGESLYRAVLTVRSVQHRENNVDRGQLGGRVLRDPDLRRALEEAILAFAGCVLVISHDLPLLDEGITSVLALEHRTVETYRGNYSSYLVERDARREQRERERTGIETLKVSYNRVHGYYIEISRSKSGQAPAEYIRRQTLKGAERFITPELKAFEDKVLSARERALQRDTGFLQHAQGFECTDDAECAIQVTRAGHRIHVRTGDDTGYIPVPVQSRMEVGGTILIKLGLRGSVWVNSNEEIV